MCISAVCGARSMRRARTRPSSRCAAAGGNSMRLGELRRTSVFRLTLLFSLLLIGSVLLLFGFVYWRTAALLERRFDEQLDSEACEIARTPPEAQAMALDNLIVSDPHEDWRGGLFDKTGQRLSGNI